MIEETISFIETLKEKKLKITLAESITAGLISSSIASIPGASSVLIGSIVTYDQEFKKKILNVKESTLNKYSAESIETSTEMAEGLKQIYPDASIYLAITGVASKPINEYTINKNVGEIFITIIYKDTTYKFQKKLKEDNRNKIREMACLYCFEKITQIIQNT